MLYPPPKLIQTYMSRICKQSQQQRRESRSSYAKLAFGIIAAIRVLVSGNVFE